MTSLAQSVKHTVTSAFSTAKVADLDGVTIDTSASAAHSGLTTDFASKISNTDTWSVLQLVFVSSLLTYFQAQGLRWQYYRVIAS